MKIGTVRWFNREKGIGFIHPDDGGHNVSVRRSAIESAGMSDLTEGQRVLFDVQRDDRTGDPSAVSLKVFVPPTTLGFDRSAAAANPLRSISAFILSAMSPLLLP
jgi:cold shock protein